jgi:hypothetical protein
MENLPSPSETDLLEIPAVSIVAPSIGFPAVFLTRPSRFCPKAEVQASIENMRVVLKKVTLIRCYSGQYLAKVDD